MSADTVSIAAKPGNFELNISRCALLIIDMQRDFLEPGGFGESLGNDVGQLSACIDHCETLLHAARNSGMRIIHTREGHRDDLSDVHPHKQARCAAGQKIGDSGPMGRILVRGEAGHDIIERLYPLITEPVIDKPGKGAFYSTDLDLLLRTQGIDSLIVCGVTTEVCVHTTVREANDRGYKILVPEQCCGSYFPEFHRAGIDMISAQGGIFGYVTDVSPLVEALTAYEAML